MLNPLSLLQPNSNIHNKNTKIRAYNARPQFSLVNSYPCDTVSFGSSSVKLKDFAEDFMRQVKNTGLTPNKLIEASITPANMIGQGGHSKVYTIPRIEDYVLKVLTEAESHIKEIVSRPEPIEFNLLSDPFKGVNLGQKIAKPSKMEYVGGGGYLGGYSSREIYGVDILVRQKGVEHSIKRWTYYVTNSGELTPSHAQKFLDETQKLSNMSDEAYLEFAKTINFLSEKGYKMDSINPNNLLIDENSINPIDYFYPNSHVFQNGCANSYSDMIGSLLDFRLFDKYHNLLNKKEKKNLIMASKSIIQKCKKASLNAGLCTDEQIYLKFLDDLDKFYPNSDHKKSFNNMKELIGNTIEGNDQKNQPKLYTLLKKMFRHDD